MIEPPFRRTVQLPDRRALIVEVGDEGDEGDEVTMWFADAPERALVLPSVTAQVIGMALQHAGSIAGARCAPFQYRRTMAREREERARRLAHAVELERLRRLLRAVPR